MYKLVGDSNRPQGRSEVSENMKNEINTLLGNEIQYKRQIKTLEKEAKELAKTYETVQSENRVLRSQLEHGIDVNKMKKLTRENSKLRKKTTEQNEELEALRTKIIELEKEIGEEKTDVIEQEWNAIVIEGKKEAEKREAELRVLRRGKFERKKKREILDEIDTKDAIDLQIDTLEKQTIILLNRIQKLSTEKYQVKFATALDKGNVTKNPVLANAINQKLHGDMNKFQERLEYLTDKHRSLKAMKDDASRQKYASGTQTTGKPVATANKASPTFERKEIPNTKTSPDLHASRHAQNAGTLGEKNWDARRQKYNMASPNLGGTKKQKSTPLMTSLSGNNTSRRNPLTKQTSKDPQKADGALVSKVSLRTAQGKEVKPNSTSVLQTIFKGGAHNGRGSPGDKASRKLHRPHAPLQEDFNRQAYDNFYDESKPRNYSPQNSQWSPSPVPINFRGRGGILQHTNN